MKQERKLAEKTKFGRVMRSFFWVNRNQVVATQVGIRHRFLQLSKENKKRSKNAWFRKQLLVNFRAATLAVFKVTS